MIVSKAFKDICVWFMFDVERDIPQGQDMIDYAIKHLDKRAKAEAERFLEQVLGQQTADVNLRDIWFQAGARIGFMDEADYRKVMEEIRRRLAGEPPTFDL